MRASSPKVSGSFLRNSCLGKWHLSAERCYDGRTSVDQRSIVRSRPMQARDPGWVLGAPTQSQACLTGLRSGVGTLAESQSIHDAISWLVLRGRHRALDLDLDRDLLS